MAGGLDVRLDWPVVRVDLTDEGVRVSSDSGQTETGSHVVVAAPLGVLKSDLLDLHAAAAAREGRGGVAGWASDGTRRSC